MDTNTRVILLTDAGTMLVRMTGRPAMSHESPTVEATDRVPWWAARRHPVRTAVALVAGPVLITVVLGIGGGALFPGADETVLRLVAVLVVMVLALATVGVAGAWDRTASAGPRSWSHTSLLVVPALVSLAPLVTGINLPTAGVLAVLVAGYLATGVFEEVLHRGIVLDALRALGVRRSAVIGGALFGASHLANIAFGQNAAVSFAQAFGAFCFGIGFAVFRWRTNAVWLLAAIHFVGDLLLHTTGLHGGLMWGFLVGHDTLMLMWGLWCLRRLPNDATLHSRPAPG